MKSLKSIVINEKRVLVLRANGAVLFADRLAESMQVPPVLALSSADCVALGSALFAMAKWIRENK